MASPLLTGLRSAWPDAHITWIAERKERQGIDAHPMVDQLLLWDSMFWKRMVRRVQPHRWLYNAFKLRQLLRSGKYDVFISLQAEEWPLVVRNSGASARIGVFDTFRQFHGATKTSRNTRFYTHPFTHPDLPAHRTDQFLLPLRALNLPVPQEKRMTVGFTAEDAAAVDRWLTEVRLDRERLVILAPMTTWPSRCWPGERFAELGDILEKSGVPVVLIGSPAEREAVEAVAARMQTPPRLAVGRFSFREMASLTSRASLLVSGDTGPMHVAAAVGTPFLSLFGPTPVEGRAPLSGKGKVLLHPVPCGPCDKKDCPNPPADFMRCMRLITVEEAFEASRSLLAPAEAALRV